MNFDDIPLEPQEQLVMGPLENGEGYFARLDKTWIQYAYGSYDEDSYGTDQVGFAKAPTLSGAVVKLFADLGRKFGTVQAPTPYELPSFKDPSMFGLQTVLGESKKD